MFSILILTKNEEANLPSCLESVQGCDDVVVLDSMSSDRTREIARWVEVAFSQLEETGGTDSGRRQRPTSV